MSMGRPFVRAKNIGWITKMSSINAGSVICTACLLDCFEGSDGSHADAIHRTACLLVLKDPLAVTQTPSTAQLAYLLWRIHWQSRRCHAHWSLEQLVCLPCKKTKTNRCTSTGASCLDNRHDAKICLSTDRRRKDCFGPSCIDNRHEKNVVACPLSMQISPIDLV